MSILDLGLLWSIYYVLHSVLASSQLKKVGEQVGLSSQVYRLIYSFISTVGLLLLLLVTSTVESQVFFPSSIPLKYIAMVIASWGVMIVISSFRYLSLLVFIGLKSRVESGLITGGIHKHVRHPIYSGTILIVIGMLLYLPTSVSWMIGIITFMYLSVGIYFEEQKLVGEFGESYVSYKRKTPAIIPKLWR